MNGGMPPPGGFDFRQPEKRSTETLFLQRWVNRDGEHLKTLDGLAKDQDADDGGATYGHRDVVRGDYLRMLGEHRCRRLADPLDMAIEGRAHACRDERGIGLGGRTKQGRAHVRNAGVTNAAKDWLLAQHAFVLRLPHRRRSSPAYLWLERRLGCVPAGDLCPRPEHGTLQTGIVRYVKD
jgi:hypothetical protein